MIIFSWLILLTSLTFSAPVKQVSSQLYFSEHPIYLDTPIIISNNEYYKVGCKKYVNQKIDLFLLIEGVALNKIHSDQNYMVFFNIKRKQKKNMSFLRKILSKSYFRYVSKKT